MRKINLLFVFGTLMIFFFSCGKTTRNKVSNTWKITEYHENSEYLNGHTSENGFVFSTYYTTEIGDENGFSRKEWDEYEGIIYPMINISGQFDKNELTIHKDGTWFSEKKYENRQTEEFPAFSRTTVTQQTEKKNGTWYFIGKNQASDFKKNEKITFFTLGITTEGSTKKTAHYHATNKDTILDEQHSTEHKLYPSGDNTTTYIVTESTPNLLKLKSVSYYGKLAEWNWDSETDTMNLKYNYEMTLKKK